MSTFLKWTPRSKLRLPVGSDTATHRRTLEVAIDLEEICLYTYPAFSTCLCLDLQTVSSDVREHGDLHR